jgi:lysophospholipase L1-like esterase
MRDNSNFFKKFTGSTIRNILFSIIIFCLFIGMVEIILRTTHLFGAKISWTEPDPILGWRYTPGRNYWYNKENNHPIIGKLNSYGWRDKEWSLKKPQNSYRIAVLGDSFVEAFQVELDNTFLALTEHQLNDNHDAKVELMNFGRSGFTQTEELLILKNEVMQFSPDMVLLFFCPLNDIEDINKETAPNIMRPYYNIVENGKLILDKSFVKTRAFKVRTFINWFKQRSALISLLAERYNAYEIHKRTKTKTVSKTKETKLLSKKISGFLSLSTANPNTIFSRNYQLNKMLIKAISEYCKDKGIVLMLVTIDVIEYLPELEKKFKLIDPTFNANFFEDDMGNYAEFLNIEYLGLQRIFRQSYENTGVSLHWNDWGHWNYQGHKLVANTLSNKLKSIIYQKKRNITDE